MITATTHWWHKQDRTERIRLAVLAGTGVIVFLLLTLVRAPNPVDDAYITFTYARNLLSGNGLVFTPGEYTFGSTTPLYALLLAVLGIGSHPHAIPSLALMLNAAALCACAFLAYAILVRLLPAQRVPAFLAAMLILVSPKLHAACMGGMEGLVFVACAQAAILACLLNRPRACGVMVGLAILTRPEGVLVGALVALALWWRSQRLPWRAGIGVAVVLLPWICFATWRYGSPVPHNLMVKLQAFHHYDTLPGATLRMLLGDLAEVFGGWQFDRRALAGAPLWKYPLVVAATAGWLACAVAFARRAPQSLLISGTVVLYLALHGTGNKLYFGWYGVPLPPFVLMTVAGGLAAMLQARPGGKPVTGRTANALLALAALALGLSQLAQHANLNIRYRVLLLGADDREPNYRATAEFLNERGTPEDAVALPEIGAFGFYTRHRPIDLVGLVTPDVLPLRKAGLDYWAITKHYMPRWIVTHAAYGQSFVQSADFAASYAPIAESGPVAVFERRDAETAVE